MISKRIDKLVEWTKWPAAFLAVATLPLTFYACWKQLGIAIQNYPGHSLMFSAGVVLFVLLARTSLAQTDFARRVVELERDLTQSALAFAMLHPVVGYGGRQSKGSRVRWLGRGNWIMLAAPYVVPTAAALMWLVSILFFQSFRCTVLGFGVSYHLITVAMQCSAGTGELRRLGRRFCWMFLPAMNMLVAGCVAAFALNGLTSVGDFLYDWISLPKLLLLWGQELAFTKDS